MIPPRQRILVTTLAALAVAIAVSLGVVGRQEASGRVELTARARTFLRTLKGDADPAAGRPVASDPAEFLRPADRGRSEYVLALRRLRDAFADTNDEMLVAQVKLLGEGRAVTYSPVSLGAPMGRRQARPGLREIAWVRGPDGRWYLDPTGL